VKFPSKRIDNGRRSTKPGKNSEGTEINMVNTYRAPFNNRNNINNQGQGTTEQTRVVKELEIKQKIRMFLRPLMSAIMPQKCDVLMMPRKVMDTKRPFCSRDRFRSH